MICPLMSMQAKTEQNLAYYVNCKKEECAWWTWTPFKHSGETKGKIGMCAIVKLAEK